jgi:hypothetical protein
MTTSQLNRPLTKAQIQYAANRIREIRNAKISAFTDSLPKTPYAPSESIGYSAEQKVELIRQGKATLKKDVWYRTDLYEAFTYPEPKRTAAEKKKHDAYEKAVKAKSVAIDKFVAALDKKVTALEDQLHLGDATSTLALIEAFAAE